MNAVPDDGLWRVPLDEFVGQAFISEKFLIDGDDGDFDIVLEWDEVGSPIWTESRNGCLYEAVRLYDFEPRCVALRTSGRTVGFYMGPMCWIRPQHRRLRLSVPLIRAGVAVDGSVPDLNRVGFSMEGWRAHAAAHRQSTLDAMARGDLPSVFDDTSIILREASGPR